MKQFYDVIVVGGGPAGIMSALASGKCGADTLLIEKNGFLGGAATASVLGPISPFHFKDEQVINGIPQDFIDRLIKENGSTGHLKTIDPFGSGDSLGFYDREKYKYVAAKMLGECGVDILYHSFIDDVMRENDIVKGVVTVAKDGLKQCIRASIVVDATGDGDIAFRAGENYSIGDEQMHRVSPSSAMFEMANVDTDAVFSYIKNNISDFEFYTDCVPMREFSRRFDQHFFVAQGFKSLVKKAVENRDLLFGRDSILLLNGIHPGTVHFNSTRICGGDSLSPEGLTKQEIDGRNQIDSVSEFMIKYVPGFENAFVSVTNASIGVRESRHIEGCYTLTGEDAAEGRKFKDVVSRGYFPIDLHNPDGGSGYGKGSVWQPLKDTYDIPYRCLVPRHIDGMLLSGRCISGTSEAHGSYRTQGGIMGIGQAAGTAAALCAFRHIQPRQLDAEAVQKKLISFGASVFRDEEKMLEEKRRVHEIVKKYIQAHRGNLITKPEILSQFE